MTDLAWTAAFAGLAAAALIFIRLLSDQNGARS